MFRFFVLISLSLLLFLQCKKEETFEPVLEIHSDFQPLVDLFVTEALQRGINIRIDNLILQYDNSIGQNLCGECNSLADPGQVQKEIRVNPYKCWEFSQELEALIFHELGHCLLLRQHLPDTLPNGDPKSLMVEGDLTVYAPCKFVLDDPANCNNLHKREYYIDELFKPETPVPDWAVK